MRVLLVPPKNNYPDPRPSVDIFGQGFPYIAGALKKAGHEVIGVNINPKWCHGSAQLTLLTWLNKAMKQCEPHLIGVGGLSADYSFVREAIRILRQMGPKIPIVLGGGIVTYDPHYILSNLHPDFAVKGEGEEAIVALADYLERGGDISRIANLAYWENGNPIWTQMTHPQPKLEDLPWPDYDPFDFEEYLKGLNQEDNIFAYTRHYPRVMPISLGRSCPFKCTFCCSRTASKYRQRSIDNALGEIAHFYTKYQFNLLFIYDELFSIRKERIREFSRKIKKLKNDLKMDFDWTCALRVSKVDKETLAEMKDAGCIFVGYGLESASPRVLKSMKKGITVDQMVRAIGLSQEVGVGVQGNFIFGDTAETPETFQETMDFFNQWCRDLIVHLGSVTPYPGSEIFQYCLEKGIVKDKQQYYNQIGGIGKYRINMTQMPDEIFFPLLDKALKITDPAVHTMLGLKEASALSFEKTDQKIDFEAPSSLRRSLHKIETICPHCGETIDYLYPFRNTPPENPRPIRICCAKCHKRFYLNISEPSHAQHPFAHIVPPSPTKKEPTPSSLADLFLSGNYALVAMTGSSDQWQTFAAMGLIGKTKAAMEGLVRFDHDEARFYSAVASWIDGDEATAIRILERIPTPHAKNLLVLIRKPQILVLAQLPWTRQAPHDLLTAAMQDKKFRIENISFHPQDIPNEPYADIRKFYDPRKPPDFYICQMVEWHLIPPNLHQLPCPLFGATADYDLHIQTVYPCLQLFDELIVTSHTEWEDVSRLVKVPVLEFPKAFGIADNLPPIPKGPREIDVFLSGSTTHPYWYEKGKLLHQILRMSDVTTLVVDGFAPTETYQMLLGQSKLTFSYIRHSGAMPTRALEALSMGCAVVVQKGSAITLYLGEEEGILTYDFEGEDLAQNIRKIVTRWPEYEQRARRGAEIVRQEFALPRVASQYLRYLTFLAAKPRGKRKIQPEGNLDLKRSIFMKGWSVGGATVLQMLLKRNLARWKSKEKINPSPHLFIDMARELALDYASVVSHINGSAAPQSQLSEILSLYKAGLTRFPQSLVLRFNLIRTTLHFGQVQDVSETLKFLEETLEIPISSWKIDVLEDVFPYDFGSNFFNYRKYFDLITENLMHGASVIPALIQLISASLYYYLGLYTHNPDHLQQAVILDPDFPFYRLEYARHLVKRGGPGDYEEACNLLMQMTESSNCFVEAFEILKHFQTVRIYQSQQYNELARLVNRFRHSKVTLAYQ